MLGERGVWCATQAAATGWSLHTVEDSHALHSHPEMAALTQAGLGSCKCAVHTQVRHLGALSVVVLTSIPQSHQLRFSHTG